jgi:3-hexulose-6-phosphate synthase/6-phospho-3-hexuloisomerase
MHLSSTPMKPVLQVALDFVNASRALPVAKDAVAGGVDWLEAGTPLIKSEGMQIIRQLRQQFPNSTIVADMKTMDTGAIETEMAAKAGANIICLLATADDLTIKDAVLSAKKYGVSIMVDLLGIKDISNRVETLEQLGVDYLCLHIGIDEQMIGKTPLDQLSEIAQSTSLPLAVAGGLTTQTIGKVVSAGAQILIVGGAITKAPDVTKATRSLKKAMKTKTTDGATYHKKYQEEELLIAFLKVSAPNISDAMHKHGAMKHIRPLSQGYHIVGQALTVETIDGDWAKPIEAIDKAESGNILVINVHGGHTAVWGELATWSAIQKKLAGIVIDGAVRDIDDIKKIGFPVFCRYCVPNAGEPKGFGEIGPEIICGEQRVCTGDWIIGDDSGVVVVPKAIAHEIANRALDVKEHENRIREEIKKGGSLGKVLELKKWEI